MDMLKRSKYTYLFFAICAVLLGVVMLIFPMVSILTVCYIIGGVAIIGGIAKLITYFKQGYGIVAGIICLALGVLFFLHPQRIVSLLPITIGIVALVDAAAKIRSSIDEKKTGDTHWWVTLLLGIVSCIGGLILLYIPFTSAKIMTRLLGIALIFIGAACLFYAIRIFRAIKKSSPIEVEYVEIDK